MPSISFYQVPQTTVPQLGQSPVVFSIVESDGAYTGSEYQYTAKLWAWYGDTNNSGSYIYEARKFPNEQGVGIFDFSKLLTSKMNRNFLNHTSSILNYKIEFNDQWLSSSDAGNIFVTGVIEPYLLQPVLDGYNLFPSSINTAPLGGFPILSDANTFTQSVLLSDIGFTSVYTEGNNNIDVNYYGEYISGPPVTDQIGLPMLTASGLLSFDSAPGMPGFPLPTAGLRFYTVNCQDKTYAYEVICEPYYEPYRVCFKNRFGAFDWITFNKKSTKTFNTDQRVYQPQLGSWNNTILTYDKYQAKSQRYIVDAEEVITLNTGYISEGYNELFKQLLVSDEIYYYKNGDYTPISIITNTLELKTGINNKLIQYTIQFNIGSSYKQII